MADVLTDLWRDACQTHRVSVIEFVVLIAAGFGGGLVGSIAGLASLVTYPALLAFGLSPVAANVTNTVALIFTGVGSISGSRPELAGQKERLLKFGAAGLIGGAVGGALLLLTPGAAFEKLVPFLIASAAAGILVRRKPRDLPNVDVHVDRKLLVFGVAAVSVYGGYFGAGAGVMMLAFLLLAGHDLLPRSNAIKNVVLFLANVIAAVAFAFFGPVDWLVALPLAIGALIGGRFGPIVVRRAPQRPLRILIAIGGFVLAIALAVQAFT